jgi:hypothetical protein
MKAKSRFSWLDENADALLVGVLLLALPVSFYWNIAWLTTAAGLLLTFVIPGWLLVRLLFGERPFELELEVLLILFVSAFLVSLVVMLLVFLGLELDRELVLMVSAATVCFLLLGLKIKDAVFFRKRVIARRPHWTALLVAVIVPLSLLGFGLLHVHETRESYTEFYVAAGSRALDEPVRLVVESHEEQVQLFTLICQNEQGEQVILGNYEIFPSQRAEIQIAHSQLPLPGEKLRIALNQHKGFVDYRWLEIPGGDCLHLTVLK